jgi:hypothetical protein
LFITTVEPGTVPFAEAVDPSGFFVVTIGDGVGAAWLNIGCGTAIGAPKEFKLVGSAFGNPRLAIAAIHSARLVAHAPSMFDGQPPLV